MFARLSRPDFVNLWSSRHTGKHFTRHLFLNFGRTRAWGQIDLEGGPMLKLFFSVGVALVEFVYEVVEGIGYRSIFVQTRAGATEHCWPLVLAVPLELELLLQIGCM